MASLSTMWTVIVGLLAVVTLVSIVLFLLKSREVTTLKKEVEELRDTMRMMRYEEINLSRMLHTVDKEDLTPNNPSEMDSLTPNPSPEERGTAGIAEVPEETFSEEPILEEPIAEESISKEYLLEEPDVETANEFLESSSEIIEAPIVEAPIAEEPIAEEPIAEEPIAEEPIAEEPMVEEFIAEGPIVEESPVEELNVEVVDEAIESPTEIQESPIVEDAASSPLSGRGGRGEADEPAPVVIGTHKQAINERRPAIPNDLFAAWFAENDAPQVEEEVHDVVEQATHAPAAVAPIVEEATAAPSVSDIPEPSGVLMESPVVVDSASSSLSERVDRDEAPIVEDLASSPVHESEGRAEVQEAEVPSQPKALSKEDERFCRKLERLVNTRMRNPNLNIDVIAAQFGMGRTNFYRKVRELMGMSPNDYLRKCRMERAAELLRTTVLPVADVCAQVGMPDAQYFSRVFKSYFGMPPSAYREQHD